jgi:hypothetical protein
MASEHRDFDSRLLLQWVLASSAAWTIGSILQLALRSSVPESIRDTGWTSGIDSAIWGVVAGVLQWLVLRQVLVRSWPWIIASGVGWALPGAVSGALLGVVGENGSGPVHIIGTGLVTGLLQWWVMRGQVQRPFAGWIAASTVLVPASLVAGAVTSFGVGLEPGPAFAILFGIVGGAVFGATTGGVLIRLLGQRASNTRIRPVGATSA